MWAVKWRSENSMDGVREHFCRWPLPPLPGYHAGVFPTRREARAFAKEHYGYIGSRPDLKAEPHGWKPVQVVKVKVQITELPTVQDKGCRMEVVEMKDNWSEWTATMALRWVVIAGSEKSLEQRWERSRLLQDGGLFAEEKWREI